MTDEQKAEWQRFIDGKWVKDGVPSEVGQYMVRFGYVLPVEMYLSTDGVYKIYHPTFGHQMAEHFFASRWRWSEPMPRLPEPPR